ncbi:MAG: outer membrane beta-barrel domain-containing protein [Bdellovibrionaceae bacterium]|nr:outer membrane beta-barrel domain-containing protein [Bdellovibrio sp.]
MKLILLSFIAVLLSYQSQVMAAPQILDDQEVVDIESLYKTAPKKAQPVAEPAQTESEKTVEQVSNGEEQVAPDAQPPGQTQAAPKNKENKAESLTDLNRLAPFSEVSVIQKKYLSKTERVQLFAGGGMTTNSPWFLNLGLKLNVAYHFTESWGVELGGLFLSNSEREVAKEIRDNNKLQPETFVTTKSYMGADIFWAPIYGKVTFLNNRIIPFDMYFTLGGGTSNTTSVEKNVPTFHVGTGQIFALSKGMAFRWDYSWTHFSATPIGAAKSEYDDLILTAGFSFFFPEAKYR